MSQKYELLGKGLYNPSEAARLVGLTPSRVRRWIQGYQFDYPTMHGRRKGASVPLICSDIPTIHHRRAVSFTELIEILMVSAFLKRGVSMRTIRKAARLAAKKLDSPHPFAFKKFRTDGRHIFLELLRESDEYKELLELSSGQYALPEILIQYLEQVEFDDVTLLASQWWPLGKKQPIVIDPSVAFGAPTIAGTRLRVSTVLDALRTGESKKAISDWYEIPPRDVMAAIEFGKKRLVA
ncbi:MAG: DUF433 domain-containing protein [Phycisphaerae bacterium]|nr:DUF433 domain-containing protein [Phycisphaerae bacterium]